MRVHDAVLQASATRFRPIIMTTAAMIFGMLPLALGYAEGGEWRQAMGTVIIGGLLSSLILTLFLVPMIYETWIGYFERRADRRAIEAEMSQPWRGRLHKSHPELVEGRRVRRATRNRGGSRPCRRDRCRIGARRLQRRFDHVSRHAPDATVAAIEAAGAARGRKDRLPRRSHSRRKDPRHLVGNTVRSNARARRRPARRQALRSLDAARVHRNLRGNVRSAVLAARATLPAMRDAKFGRIVFFGMLGSEATRPFRGFSLYQSAKSALVAFARCLALEEASNQ